MSDGIHQVAAAGSMDTHPSFLHFLEQHGSAAAKCRTAPCRAVKPLDVIEYVSTDRLSNSVELSGCTFDFQGNEETLHCRDCGPHLRRYPLYLKKRFVNFQFNQSGVKHLMPKRAKPRQNNNGHALTFKNTGTHWHSETRIPNQSGKNRLTGSNSGQRAMVGRFPFAEQQGLHVVK